MEWSTPTFVEIKMDAEINAYHEDYEPTRDPQAPRDPMVEDERATTDG